MSNAKHTPGPWTYERKLLAEALLAIEHSTDPAWIKELAASALAKAGL